MSDIPERVARWRDSATFALVLCCAFAVPLAVFARDAYDPFRLPKALLFQSIAILILFVQLAAIALGAKMPRPDWRSPWVVLPLLALATMLLVTVTSTRPALSVSALASAAATLVVFFATVSVARDRGAILLAAPLVAACANAIVLLLQELHLWMPFGVRPGVPHHLQCTALIGNPNEVGAYLGVATLAVWSAATTPAALTTAPRSLRFLALAILTAALIAAQTITALGAFTIAVLAMFARISFKTFVRAALAGAVIGAIVIALVAPFRTRAANMAEWAKVGRYNSMTTERLTPFVAAWSLFLDHPLTGAGPDTFAWHYFDAKLAAEERFPTLREAYNRGINYGEVHNDHLQVLAEGGVAGYGVFLAMLIALASISFTSSNAFARNMALPLAVFWAVLSIAQFPLETTVVRGLMIHLAALCVAWRTT